MSINRSKDMPHAAIAEMRAAGGKVTLESKQRAGLDPQISFPSEFLLAILPVDAK